MDNKIRLTSEDGEELEFYVLEETRINGINYLLVTDAPEDEEGECCILKDMSGSGDSDAIYEAVEDEQELQYLSKIFNELLEDVVIES